MRIGPMAIRVIGFCSVVSTVFVFQNCGNEFHTNPVVASDLPITHPSIDLAAVATPATGQIVIGDRDYLESVFNDVFSSADVNVQNYVAAVLEQEFLPVQASLGRPCDPYQDGSLHSCNYSVPNTSFGMNATSSSIREAARIQVCRRLLGNDAVLTTVVNKIGNISQAPTATALNGAIQLFYPASDVDSILVAGLASLDQGMARNSETLMNRWRLIFSTICEADTWQIL